MVLFLVLLACALLTGSILGYVGWWQSRRALRELAALRAQLAARPMEAAPTPAAPMAEPVPAPGPEPTPEPVPQPIAEPVQEAFFEPPRAEPPIPPPAPAPKRPAIDIELLLTQRWGIWLGSAALLLAAVFLVRTAIAEGWLGPAPRCALSFLLGAALIALAEWTRRNPPARLAAHAAVLVDNGPAALAAGGVAALFAGAYGAGPLYSLVPPFLSFILMAASSFVGLALSLRFGPLVGLVGLAAAYGTPALVVTNNPSLPGLFAYLALVTIACWAVVRRTAWIWLGWVAIAAGACWVLLTTAESSNPSLWAAGLFIPIAAASSLVLLPPAAFDHKLGRHFAWAPMDLLGLAGLVLACVTGDPFVRAGLFALAPLAMARAWTEERWARLPLHAAGLSILTLALWAVPAWTSTDVAITIDGVVQAVLPGPWAPEALIPFLQTAALVAALHAAAGLLGERRRQRPLPWASLTAAVPVLILAIAYLQIGRFQSDAAWAAMALALAAALSGTATLARRSATAPLERAGIHAAGAVAALALGFSILLTQAWLTVALALILPALAWIARASGVRGLRGVALAIAAVVLVRLVLNPAVLDYPVGTTPVLNGLLIAYGLPCLCFAAAAWLFARDADDITVAVLEAGACLFAGLLVVLEIRHTVNGGMVRGGEPGIREWAWQVSGMGAFAAVLMELGTRRHRPVMRQAATIAASFAAIGAFALLIQYPGLKTREVGSGLVFNLLLPAYLIPAILAAYAVRWIRGSARLVPGLYALLALLLWITATIHQAFRPRPPFFWGGMAEAELWWLSAAWFVLAGALLAAGLARGQRPLRLAGLGVMALVIVKVFLVDMAGLTGLLRVLSFLGLGLGLIALGRFYRRFGAERS